MRVNSSCRSERVCALSELGELRQEPAGLSGGVNFRHDQRLELYFEGLLLPPVLRVWEQAVNVGVAQAAKSLRQYPQGVSVRRVRSNGEIKWKGAKVYLTQALTGESVGLKQESEDNWAVYFGPLQIELLDETTMKVIKTLVRLLPMSPV